MRFCIQYKVYFIPLSMEYNIVQMTATASSHETINLLKKKFGESIITRKEPVNWPPRTCDLTPLEFFYGVM